MALIVTEVLWLWGLKNLSLGTVWELVMSDSMLIDDTFIYILFISFLPHLLRLRPLVRL